MVMCNSCVLWGDVETNLISYEMGWDGMGEYCGDDIAKPTRGGEFFGVDLSLSHSFTLSPVFNFSVDVTYFLFSFFFIFYFIFFRHENRIPEFVISKIIAIDTYITS